jgi:hypothetical protein
LERTGSGFGRHSDDGNFQRILALADEQGLRFESGLSAG